MDEQTLHRFNQGLDIALDLPSGELLRLKAENPSSYAAFLQMRAALRRSAARRGEMTGWDRPLEPNYFASLRQASADPDYDDALLTAVMQASHRGDLYFHLARWDIAEEHYKVGIDTAILIQALGELVHLATQLALAYVAGGRPVDAVRLGLQLLDFAAVTVNVDVRVSIWTSVPTIVRLANGQALLLEQAAADAVWASGLPSGIPNHEAPYRSVRAALVRSGAGEKAVAEWDDVWRTLNLVSRLTTSQVEALLDGAL